MKKSTIAKLLVICLIVGLMGSSFAATAANDTTVSDKGSVYSLGNGVYGINMSDLTVDDDGYRVINSSVPMDGDGTYQITLSAGEKVKLDGLSVEKGGSITIYFGSKVLFKIASGINTTNVEIVLKSTATARSIPSGRAVKDSVSYDDAIGSICGKIEIDNANGTTQYLKTLADSGLDVKSTTRRYTERYTIKGDNVIWSVKRDAGTTSGNYPTSTTTPATTTKPGGFTDVVAGSYYADAVAWAVANGITTGTSATTFSPNASCTRAEMVTFLWRLAGSPAASGNNPFTDVAAGSWYYDAVMWAVANNITTGTSATTFSPTNIVDRAQSVTFLYRYAGQPTVETTSKFADVTAGAYYADAVNWAAANGVTTGTSDTTFSPTDVCSRAQIVTFMYRYAGQN